MTRRAASIDLSMDERTQLESLARRRRTSQGLAQRAQIVLQAAEGHESKAIAHDLGIMPNMVGKWRRRFAEHRLDGSYDDPRPGRPREIGDDEIAILSEVYGARGRQATDFNPVTLSAEQ